MNEKSSKVEVYSIGNPLIDVLAQASDREIAELDMDKGTMMLIDCERGNFILDRINEREKQFDCGGSAPNTMITLAALGIRTILAGVVGNDRLGDIYRERLNEKNVISDLVTCEGDTGTCIVLITPDHERTMNTRLGVCQKFGPQNVNHDKIKAADYLYFTGYMWDTESQKEALTAAIETAQKAGTKVVFDLADPFAVKRHHGDFLNLLTKSVDVLFANREEARLLLGIDDPVKAAKELGTHGVIAAVKDCTDGSCISAGNSDHVSIDAYNVDAVDSTGAGDNYAAGFLYGLIKGYSLADSGKLASYVAAQIVRKTGAQFDEQAVKEMRMAIKEGYWRQG